MKSLTENILSNIILFKVDIMYNKNNDIWDSFTTEIFVIELQYEMHVQHTLNRLQQITPNIFENI